MAETIPEINTVKNLSLDAFKKKFGEDATICVCAPGRVNLIGEHTDYNEGFVLPMALSMVTIIAAKPTESFQCSIISMSESLASTSKAEFTIEKRELIKPGEPKWANYMKGVIANFPFEIPSGFNAVVMSSVPMGAGLSSSAALEVATYTLLEVLTNNYAKDLKEKAMICQKAEHDFAGVPCGIMDQFISVMGKDKNALLLDCRDLSVVHVPMDKIDDNCFLITNSNSPHKLSSSAYCERRDTCYEAAKKLNKKSLREVNIQDLKHLKSLGASDVMLKRVQHVVKEILRTQEAVEVLKLGNYKKFGELMNQSHDSLRDDYEVSSPELDTLVDCARSVEGVFGSRLTGAGFGGCTITLLKENAIPQVIEKIKKTYKGNATFYIAKPASGARKLDF